MNLIVAGGTFDLLHAGHKSFLQNILSQTDHMILGLTSDDYVSSNKLGNIDNFETRRKNLQNFFKSIGKKTQVEIISIVDVFGPLLDFSLNPDAIAVTESTKNSVEIINSKRSEVGLSILKSIIIPIKLAEDGVVISSTRIRNGEIDREGNVYFKREWQGRNLRLPEILRGELSSPFGEVLKDIPDGLLGEKTITVGDVTTKLFNDNKIAQFLSIIDFKVQRKKQFRSIEDLGFLGGVNLLNVQSGKGIISSDLFEASRKVFSNNERTVIIVEGEDDLSVLVCLIFSPLEYSIFYGQPNVGLVEVKVTEENKNKAYRLLKQFVIS